MKRKESVCFYKNREGRERGGGDATRQTHPPYTSPIATDKASHRANTTHEASNEANNTDHAPRQVNVDPPPVKRRHGSGDEGVGGGTCAAEPGQGAGPPRHRPEVGSDDPFHALPPLSYHPGSHPPSAPLDSSLTDAEGPHANYRASQSSPWRSGAVHNSSSPNAARAEQRGGLGSFQPPHVSLGGNGDVGASPLQHPRAAGVVSHSTSSPMGWGGSVYDVGVHADGGQGGSRGDFNRSSWGGGLGLGQGQERGRDRGREAVGGSTQGTTPPLSRHQMASVIQNSIEFGHAAQRIQVCACVYVCVSVCACVYVCVCVDVCVNHVLKYTIKLRVTG